MTDPKFYFNSSTLSFEVTDSCTLGRSDADIVLKDPKLSAKHCRFDFQGDQLFVVDLESTNGTFLNGKQLKPNIKAELHPGDQLQLGTVQYGISQAPVELFEWKNLMNFYGVGWGWRCLYIIVLLFSGVLIHIEISRWKNGSLPPNLAFLESFWLSSMLTSISILLAGSLTLSLIHAYLIKFRVKNLLTKIVIGTSYLLLTFILMIASQSMAEYINLYARGNRSQKELYFNSVLELLSDEDQAQLRLFHENVLKIGSSVDYRFNGYHSESKVDLEYGPSYAYGLSSDEALEMANWCTRSFSDQSCLRTAAITSGWTDVCDLFPNSQGAWNCRLEIYQLAKSTSWLRKHCDGFTSDIGEQELQDNCFQTLASLSLDTEVCQGLSEKGSNLCYTGFALSRQDPSYCEKIPLEGSQKSCRIRLEEQNSSKLKLIKRSI
jgi:hypothetical protein